LGHYGNVVTLLITTLPRWIYGVNQQLVRIRIEAVGMDSTIVKVHPDGTGALKKTALKPSANPEPDG
jgi:hypothetical protein